MKSILKYVNNSKSLIEYLEKELNWPINLEDVEDEEDLYFEYTAAELGIKSEDLVAKIENIKQLRPITYNQPWGVFIIEFEKKKIPVTALRKILSTLIPSKRKENLEHEIWNKENLLFFCFFGNADERSIGIAKFTDNKNMLPTLKVLSWNPYIENENVLMRYEEKFNCLKWLDQDDIQIWKSQWSKFFTRENGQVVRDSRLLARELANLSKETKKAIVEFYKIEEEKGYLHKLYVKFRQELIHDLSIEHFADMYAQTVAYGLFSARCMTSKDEKFEIENAVDKIPNTNPFLKELLRSCFKYSIEDKNKVRFDELDIGDIVELLSNIDTDEILLDFGKQSGEGMEDPILYFYEGFLNEFENEIKRRRGVYYTPKPVVEFMIRAVDDILKDEFGYKDGLADISTKKINYTRQSLKKKDGFYYDIEDEKEVPAVQILDPATGTGTFLHEIILKIKENFDEKHKGKTPNEIKQLWNEYVPKYLLPRINGFELMMAPYAVAHMNLGIALKETGYEFRENKRINVFLTNTLEQAGATELKIDIVGNELVLQDPLTAESQEANKVKCNDGINIIIGNPPYSGHSANNDIKFIQDLLRGRLSDGTKTENYFEVDGKPLNEKNPKWLNDDYVKFIRYGQNVINNSKNGGILAFITNHGYLDNPTFRGMRQSLVSTFDNIYIIDLHGNSKKKEKCQDGSKDENVFDIQQGVSIALFIRNPQKNYCNNVINHYDLWGLRKNKYNFLKQNSIENINWTNIDIAENSYNFIKQNNDLLNEYNNFIALTDIFDIYSVGITTSRDNMVMDFKKEVLLKRIEEYKNSKLSNEDLCDYFNVSMKKGWDINKSREMIKNEKNLNEYLKQIAYRPFDNRFIFYHDALIERKRKKVMLNMLNGDNIGLISARSNKSQKQNQFFCTKLIMETKCGESTTQSAIFPLFKIANPNAIRKSNIKENVINLIKNKLNIKDILEQYGNYHMNLGNRDIFNYIYAITFSNNYRSRYYEFIRLDFPKIPFTANKDLFLKLSKLGDKLIKVHLLEYDVCDRENIKFVGDNKEIIKVNYKDEKVYIDKNEFFSSVSNEVYNFEIGGYKPCEKWLKYRKGYVLSNDDIEHYKKIVCAITETIKLMDEIDKTIDEYGGWPIG